MVVGAAKCGTNSVHRYLSQHPQVFMIPDKEASFFTKQKFFGQRFCKTEAEYLKLYRQAPASAKFRGESSVIYSSAPLVADIPAKLFAFNPQMRFVYLMRDPIERIISHYLMLVRQNLEHRSLLEASTQSAHLVQVSHYAMQLEHFFESFPREQFFIRTTEELKHHRFRVMTDLFLWLGLDPLPESQLTRLPEFYQASEAYGETWYSKLLKHPILMPLIKAVVPARCISRGKDTLLPRAPTKEDLDPNEIRDVHEYLGPLCRVYVESLSRLLDRGFPEWTFHAS